MILAPGAKPLEPFGKGSNALKVEARDDGPDPVLPKAHKKMSMQPSVQLPAGIDEVRGL